MTERARGNAGARKVEGFAPRLCVLARLTSLASRNGELTYYERFIRLIIHDRNLLSLYLCYPFKKAQRTFKEVSPLSL